MTLFLIKKMTKNWVKKWPQKTIKKWCRKTVKKWPPKNIKKWPKIKRPQKCQKTRFFMFFKETPKNGQNPPGGVGGSKKGVRGVPGGPKKGVRGGPSGGSRGGRFWGSLEGNALKMGVNPTPARAPQRDFSAKTGQNCMADPQNRRTWVEKMTDFRRKISPFPPAEKYGAKCPKKLVKIPQMGGSKNVPLFNVSPTPEFRGTFFFYRPPKPPFPSVNPRPRNARKGFFWFSCFLLQPGLGKNVKKAPMQICKLFLYEGKNGRFLPPFFAKNRLFLGWLFWSFLGGTPGVKKGSFFWVFLGVPGGWGGGGWGTPKKAKNALFFRAQSRWNIYPRPAPLKFGQNTPKMAKNDQKWPKTQKTPKKGQKTPQFGSKKCPIFPSCQPLNFCKTRVSVGFWGGTPFLPLFFLGQPALIFYAGSQPTPPQKRGHFWPFLAIFWSFLAIFGHFWGILAKFQWGWPRINISMGLGLEKSGIFGPFWGVLGGGPGGVKKGGIFGGPKRGSKKGSFLGVKKGVIFGGVFGGLKSGYFLRFR